MTYQVRIKPTAEKAIERLDAKVRERVYEVLRGLARNPRPDGCKKLKGQLRNRYRVKAAWAWVIIYVVDDKPMIVEILDVDTRGDAY